MPMGWPEIPFAAGDGKEGDTGLGQWGSRGAVAAPGPNLRKGCIGAATQEKALPWSPSNHEQQEQHVAGSDWFAPVASLQAPRDSCLGTAGLLKGHLRALILRWGRGKGEGGVREGWLH